MYVLSLPALVTVMRKTKKTVNAGKRPTTDIFTWPWSVGIAVGKKTDESAIILTKATA